MKQTTIFDYFPKSKKQKNYHLNFTKDKTSSQNKFQKVLQQKKNLTKSYLQKTLSQLIKEQEDFQRILTILGNTWYKQKEGFGFTDKNNIMTFSTIQDFNNNFFNIYNFEDFERIENSYLDMDEIIENKSHYIIAGEFEYNSYYLSKSFKILGNKCEIFQHTKLKLLFLKNDRYAALICPKF